MLPGGASVWGAGRFLEVSSSDGCTMRRRNLHCEGAAHLQRAGRVSFGLRVFDHNKKEKLPKENILKAESRVIPGFRCRPSEAVDRGDVGSQRWHVM